MTSFSPDISGCLAVSIRVGLAGRGAFFAYAGEGAVGSMQRSPAIRILRIEFMGLSISVNALFIQITQCGTRDMYLVIDSPLIEQEKIGQAVVGESFCAEKLDRVFFFFRLCASFKDGARL